MMSETTLDMDLKTNGAAGPVDVETFEFEPIKGYPMLNWRGKRPFRSTHYYPAQLKEVHGEEVDGWRNKIFWGDNLQVMSHLLREFRGKIDLVYIDPPFDSRAEYKKQVELKAKRLSSDHTAFEAKQYTDIWTNDEYLQFMYERLVLLRELLSESGSIYLHCDHRQSHRLRCILDEVFGPDRYLNEIVWKRTYARSDSHTFNHIHDTIFVYSKTDSFFFHQQYLPHDPAYIDKYYTYRDPDGRRFAAINPTQSGLRNGSTGQPWRGFSPSAKGNHWKVTIDELERLDRERRIYWPSKEGGWPRLKSYLDETKGVAIQSIWTDIMAVNSQASERGSYPTQKPEVLLDRIITASSPEGGIVLDCFMGSGTTQAVALKRGRKFIGADINLGAIRSSIERLSISAETSFTRMNETVQAQTLSFDESDSHFCSSNIYGGLEVYNVNHYDLFRNPVEARDLLLDALEVQKLPDGSLFDGEKDGRMIKIMPVNRIATRAELTSLITGFDYKAFERRQAEDQRKPVEKITLVCMGHEPDLAATLKKEVPFPLDVEVVDILRDRGDLQFKRDSEASIALEDGWLVIKAFYPMNLLQKLSLQKEKVEDWREMVDSVMIDWNYDGAVFTPATVDVPDKNALVVGRYQVPAGVGTIRVKITDVLSESLEVDLDG